jgi:hypothetical protein
MPSFSHIFFRAILSVSTYPPHFFTSILGSATLILSSTHEFQNIFATCLSATDQIAMSALLIALKIIIEIFRAYITFFH